MAIVRNTKKLELIRELFEAKSEAISAVELANTFKDQMNKTTVYRILDRMEDDGIIHSFNDSKGTRWFAKCSDCQSHKHSHDHPHFECKECGLVECLEVDVNIPKIPDKKIQTTDIILVGTCEKCSL